MYNQSHQQGQHMMMNGGPSHQRYNMQMNLAQKYQHQAHQQHHGQQHHQQQQTQEDMADTATTWVINTPFPPGSVEYYSPLHPKSSQRHIKQRTREPVESRSASIGSSNYNL
jgi:CCR4-NOT transcription complex subunit 6